MRSAPFRTLAIALGLGAIASATPGWAARADNSLVRFPEAYTDGVHYGTVERGTITEELYASRAAIEAAKRGEPFPSGTAITLVDFRGGKLHRYVVMEKRVGWGKLSPSDVRAGDWLFREFAPDGSPNLAEDGTRCMSCHRSQKGQDFVFTVEQMRNLD